MPIKDLSTILISSPKEKLNTHTLTELRKHVRMAVERGEKGYKGYSTMKKPDLVNLMVKSKKFSHLGINLSDKQIQKMKALEKAGKLKRPKSKPLQGDFPGM
jgi:hypothetical protein